MIKTSVYAHSFTEHNLVKIAGEMRISKQEQSRDSQLTGKLFLDACNMQYLDLNIHIPLNIDKNTYKTIHIPLNTDKNTYKTIHKIQPKQTSANDYDMKFNSVAFIPTCGRKRYIIKEFLLSSNLPNTMCTYVCTRTKDT